MKRNENGLVLLEDSELVRVHFQHLVTSLDEDLVDSQTECGRFANITGSTEWFSESVLYLTVGWDWVIDERDHGRMPWRLGLPRTNVNLVDVKGKALHWEASLERLGELMDSILPWQQMIRALEVRSTEIGKSLLSFHSRSIL